MTTFKPTQRESYQVLGDTECWRQERGYNRTLILNQWDESDPRRIARVTIRVDQYRHSSYAHIDVWVPATGWAYITSEPAENWWEKVPGYNRSGTVQADNQTMNIVDALVDALIECTYAGRF